MAEANLGESSQVNEHFNCTCTSSCLLQHDFIVISITKWWKIDNDFV